MEKLYVQGLRTADALTLEILTQDLLRRTLSEITLQCLCDMLSLADATGLPKQLSWEMERYAPQMQRELHDLLAGKMWGAFIQELHGMSPEQIPTPVREVVVARYSDAREHPESMEQYRELLERLENVAPLERDVETQGRRQLHVRAYEVPDSHKAPDERKKRRVREGSAASTSAPREPKGRATSPSRAKTRTPPKEIKDPSRAQWIRADVLEKLSQLNNGLKQNMLLAGMMRRAPYNDLARNEIMDVLKELAKEGRIKVSAGRWSSTGRR